MPQKSSTEAPGLLEALAAAGEQDLAKISAKIDELERELAGLKEAKKLLDRRLNGAPARKPRETGEGNGNSLAERIYEVLATVGQATPKAIAHQVGSTPQGVGRALSASEWFKKLDTGEWAIAKAADRK